VERVYSLRSPQLEYTRLQRAGRKRLKLDKFSKRKRSIISKEAQTLGILQTTVSPEEPFPTVFSVSKSLVDGKSMTNVKRAVDCVIKGYNETIESGLSGERKQFAVLFLTGGAKEGVQAFIEKRGPLFNQS